MYGDQNGAPPEEGYAQFFDASPPNGGGSALLRIDVQIEELWHESRVIDPDASTVFREVVHRAPKT